MNPTPKRFVALIWSSVWLVAMPVNAATVTATYPTATTIPVTATSYTATGNTVNFTLNFAPATGTELTVVKNTGLGFINGTFDNLAQGQTGGVALRRDHLRIRGQLLRRQRQRPGAGMGQQPGLRLGPQHLRRAWRQHLDT